jgi:hypothetical protein
MGLGPQLTALLRSLAPPAGVADAVRSTQLDVLKFLKSMIDQRIANLATGPGAAAGARGTRVPID